MSSKIITISREFGSGGRSIGRLVAEKLGIPCYDAELILKIASESGYDKDFIENQGEDFSLGVWMFAPLGAQIGGGALTGVKAPEEALWDVQKKVIEEIAGQGPCVIIGRCADHILEGRADLLKVFIYAPLEERVKVVKEKYGADEKALRKKDKHRKAYYKYCTDREFGNVRNYHVALDSSVFGIEKCADIITELYRD